MDSSQGPKLVPGPLSALSMPFARVNISRLPAFPKFMAKSTDVDLNYEKTSKIIVFFHIYLYLSLVEKLKYHNINPFLFFLREKYVYVIKLRGLQVPDRETA